MSQSQFEPDRAPSTGTPYRTPRWVKVFGIIGIVVILLIVIALVTGLGGPHGPGRHNPSGEAGSAPSGDTFEVSSGGAAEAQPSYTVNGSSDYLGDHARTAELTVRPA